MYPVKSLSRDKGKGADTKCICPFRPKESVGRKGQIHFVPAPFPLSRERDFTRYMGNPYTHIGVNTGLGVPKKGG